MARLGFAYRKPKALPRVADVERQAAFIAFYANLLNNLPVDEAVYFSDAVHPEYQSKPSHGWARKGSNPAIQTTSGRGRVNIHGGSKPGNLRCAFRLTNDRRWYQLRSASCQNRGQKP